MSEDLRLTEILTTASAVANYVGAPVVEAAHLLSAIRILLEEQTLDDLGRPLSPMVARVTRPGSTVDAGVQELAQRWFKMLGGDATAELDAAHIATLRAELVALDTSSRH